MHVYHMPSKNMKSYFTEDRLFVGVEAAVTHYVFIYKGDFMILRNLSTNSHN